MSLLVQLLFWVAAIGSVTSTIYCLMVLVAAVRFGLRRRREEHAALNSDFLPPVSVLKPLHGTEDGLERNLETFFEQEYPHFELLFCARHESDPGLQLAREVGKRFPHVDARYMTCGEPPAHFHNAKVFSLATMDAVASHELYVTSDADARVSPDYLCKMIQNLKDPKMGLASSIYIGTVHRGTEARLSSHLDAVGKSVEMSSGVMVADMLEGTKFALGVTMVLRKQSFVEAGGFEELGQFYADDFVLGNRLATRGTGVRLASHVIRLLVEDTPFSVSFRNQLRWMQSTRRSRPWGHLGTGLTFAMPFGLLGLLWGLVSGHAGLGVLWLLAMVVNRWLQAGTVLTMMGDPEWMRGMFLYPLRDLLGSILWLGSYGGDRFYYRGQTYRLREGGRVETP
jgi:ceramide glucosyltransferase